MNKYGYSNFKIEIIEKIQNNKLNQQEKYWIAFYESNNSKYGYNMTEGGEGGDTWTNNPHKKETAKKISLALKGKHTLSKFHHKKMIDKAREINTIFVNKQELKKDIKNFMSIEEMCKKYKISRKTFYNKCKAYFNLTPTEIRKGRLTHTNTLKILLSKEKIDWFLKLNKSLEEMAKQFKVSKETVRRRIIEIYGTNLREVRKIYDKS